MKKILSLLAVLMVAMTSLADNITPVLPTTGNGSEDSPYEIGSPGNLVWFAQQVNSGFTSIYGKLTDNINLGTDQTMIGTSTNKYSGTFDGDHHTVTVAYNATEAYTALFRYVDGATIKNIHTAGTIETTNQFAAGIVAHSDNILTISSSSSSVAITSSFDTEKDGTHGGIVANTAGKATLNGVFFNGQLYGKNAKNCGGLVGWSATSITLAGCLFSPSAAVTFSTTGSSTMSRGNGVTCNGCFYTTSFATVQGNEASSEDLKSGKICCDMNDNSADGTISWYQNLGVDTIPVLDPSHKRVYTGDDICCSTNKYENYTHTYDKSADDKSSYADGILAQTCTVDGCGHTNEIYEKPAYDTGTGFYYVGNRGNLLWFAKLVNAGNKDVNCKLTADIDLGDYQTVIGDYHFFAGTFDGDNHTVTVHYVPTSTGVALFYYIERCTIKNLHVAGTITTSIPQCAGLAYFIADNNTNITDCVVSVSIISTQENDTYCGHGGIIALNRGANTRLTNVVFDGKLIGPHATGCGGMAGYPNGVYMKGCLFAPSEMTFSSTDAATFAPSGGKATNMTNCCFTTALGEEQGTKVSDEDIKTGRACYALNGGLSNGTQSWYQTLGVDQKPVLDSTHGTVYGMGHACTLSSPSDYSNTENKNIYTNGFYKCDKCGTKCYEPAKYEDGTWLLANKGNIVWLSQQIDGLWFEPTSSSKYSVTNDIDLEEEQYKLGQYGPLYIPLCGTFNGNGHTITIHYDSSEQYTAFIMFAQNLTINDLMVAGTINTSAQYASGLVGDAWEGVKLHRCCSSVEIISTYNGEGNCGGLISSAANQDPEVDNCAFIGSFIGWYTSAWGGIAHTVSAFAPIIKNSLFAPEKVVISSETNSYVIINKSRTNQGCRYVLPSDMIGKMSESSNEWYNHQESAASTEHMTSGSLCYAFNGGTTDGTQAWYQNIGTDRTPLPIYTHKTVYYTGVNYCPVNIYTNTLAEHKYGDVDDDECAYCTECNNGDYTPATYNDATASYIIAKKSDFGWFARNINLGTIQANSNATVTADINLDNDISMIGTAQNKYAGTFDGGGHTIKVNYKAVDEYVAPFRFINGATIKNLRTAGTIESGHQFAAGIAACTNGSTNITNCESNIAITNTFTESKDATNGGIVANFASGSLTLDKVVFSGKLLGAKAINCGGLIGWSYHDVYVKNCIYGPSEVTVSTDGSCTLSRGTYVHVTNTYYTSTLGTAQGTEISADVAASGAMCCNLNGNKSDGTQTWYQNLATNYDAETDICPVPLSTHGTVYTGDDAHPKTLTYSNQTHIYENINGFMQDAACGMYKFEDFDTPEYDAATATYLIKNMGNLVWFADSVNKSDHVMNAKLTRTITLADGFRFPIIGNSASHPFRGTFDGQGHRIKNMTVSSSNELIGFFGVVAGTNTVIKNVIIDSSCSVTSTDRGKYGVAGLIGGVKPYAGTPANVTILNCGNEATILGGYNVAGILGGVYENDNNTISMINCYNTGAIQGNSESATLCGYARRRYTFINCYNSGTLNGVESSNYSFRQSASGTVINCYDVNGSNNGFTKVYADKVASGCLSDTLLNKDSVAYVQNLSNHPIPAIFGFNGAKAVHVTNAQELYEVANATNHNAINMANLTVYLDNDIDCTGFDYEPIGVNQTYPYRGNFNGQGHRIKNLVINTIQNKVGLFGCIAGSDTHICNTIIDSSCSITSTGNAVAGLVGCVDSPSGSTCNIYIEDCGNEAPIRGGVNTAGILGAVYTNEKTRLNVEYCYNTGSIWGTKESAALCGYARLNRSFLRCFNTGSLRGVDGQNYFIRTQTYGLPSLLYCNCNYDVNGEQKNVSDAVTADQIRLGNVCAVLNIDFTRHYSQDIEHESHPYLSVEPTHQAGLSYSRTMANHWGTIVLPFDVEIAKNEQCEFYSIASVSGEALTLKAMTDTLHAGTPAVILMSDDALNKQTGKYELYLKPAGNNVTTAITTSDAVNGITLTGVFSNTNVAKLDGYIIGNNAFWNIAKINDGKTLYCPAFRAYLSGTLSNAAKQLTIGFGDDTSTAIDTQEVLNAITDVTAEYYDLNGRKLNELQKGINIVRFSNGVTKKVIVK